MKKCGFLINILFPILCVFFNGCHPNPPATVIPVAPTQLNAYAASNSNIELAWTDNATNESGYRIQRKISGTDFVEISTVAANTTTYSDTSVNPNTTYIYRVCAYNSAGNSALFSNEDSAIILINTVMLPEITTENVTAIDTIHAISGGNVLNDGGAVVVMRGVCWGMNPNPTIDLPTKTSDGSGMGTFSSNLNMLTPNTIYHVRAYATNSVGTAYGNEMIFTTLPLPVIMCGVNIGGQTWSCKNLDLNHYANGDTIPQVSDPQVWMNLTTGAWCWYNNDSLNYGTKYGRLYNWYAVNDPRGLAPAGWHIPTESEWSKLIKYLDPTADTVCDYCTSSTTAGGAMKSIGLLYWISPNNYATNSSGFTALPGGMRSEIGNYSIAGHMAVWWSANESDTWRAYYRYVYYFDANASRYNIDKHCGYSVRVIKN